MATESSDDPPLDDWDISAIDPGFRVFRRQQHYDDFADAEHAARAVASEIELNAAARSPLYVAVHAAVVAATNGAIVIPGRSLAGKSVLTAALLRLGACYLSDEYALLDENGLVHPYPRKLRIRREHQRHPALVPPEDLGGQTASDSVQVRLIAQLWHEPGATLNLGSLTPGEAVLALIDNAVPATVNPRRTLEWCAAAASGAVAVSGPRGEADVTARRLLEMLSEVGPSA